MFYHSNAYIVKFLTAILEVQTMSAMKINTSMKSEQKVDKTFREDYLEGRLFFVKKKKDRVQSMDY